MDEKQNKLSDLQEIFFWQQLNKQIIELKKKGKVIQDEHLSYLQNFCFDNKLFSKISKASLIDEVPLILLTDLSRYCFFNIKEESWIDCLIKLIPNLIILDVDEALANAFDTLREYDRKYNLIQDGDEFGDVEDHKLYEIIYQYIEDKSDLNWNFADPVLEVYNLKGNALREILAAPEIRELIITSEEVKFLDLKNLPHMDAFHEINSIYYDKFCAPSRRIAYRYKNVRKLFSRLEVYLSQGKKFWAVNQFVEHEIALLQKESAAFKTFWSNTFRRGREKNHIHICNYEPFSFLENPLPTI